MGAGFKSAFEEIAVPIRPLGHHPSNLMANHLNIVSPGTCLPFWISGAKWLLFNCRSLWLFVWETDGLLTRAETDKCWPYVQLYSVFLKLLTFRIIFHRFPQDLIYIFSKLNSNMMWEKEEVYARMRREKNDFIWEFKSRFKIQLINSKNYNSNPLEK